MNRAVPATEICAALRVSRNTYAKRSQADTFPDADECRLIAEHFYLNPVELQMRFGLITEEHLKNLGAR